MRPCRPTCSDDSARSANPHALSSLREPVGTDRIFFGSDYPFAPELATQVGVAGPAAHSFSDADRLAVDRRSALALLSALSARLEGKVG